MDSVSEDVSERKILSIDKIQEINSVPQIVHKAGGKES